MIETVGKFGISIAMYRDVLILWVCLTLFLGCSSYSGNSRNELGVNKKGQIDSVFYVIDSGYVFTVHFDRVGFISSIYTLRENNFDGMSFFFTCNKIDSIRRYNEGLMTSEVYVFDKGGKLIKHNGLNGRLIISGLIDKIGHFNSTSESITYDSIHNVSIIRSYINPSLKMGYGTYEIYVSANRNVYSIVGMKSRIAIFLGGSKNLVGVYTYDDSGVMDGFRLLCSAYRGRPESIEIIRKGESTARWKMNRRGKWKVHH